MTITKNDLEDARRGLMERLPGFSTLIGYFQGRWVARPGKGTVAVDRGMRVYFDPDLPWSGDKLMGALEHELGHIVRNHFKRADLWTEMHSGEAVDYRVWNEAGDLEINDDLTLPLPDGYGIFPGQGEYAGFKAGHVAEAYYKKLKGMVKPPPPPQPPQDPDDPDEDDCEDEGGNSDESGDGGSGGSGSEEQDQEQEDEGEGEDGSDDSGNDADDADGDEDGDGGGDADGSEQGDSDGSSKGESGESPAEGAGSGGNGERSTEQQDGGQEGGSGSPGGQDEDAGSQPEEGYEGHDGDCGSCSGGPARDDELPMDDPNTPGVTEEQVDRAVEEAKKSTAKAMADEAPKGGTPGQVSRIAEGVFGPEAMGDVHDRYWQSVLHREVAKHMKTGGRGYQRPSRRLHDRRIIHMGTTRIPPRIVFVVDTSGSIGEVAARKAFGIIDKFRGWDLDFRVVACDTNAEEVKKGDTGYSGGGTNMGVGIEFASKKMGKVDACFVITDAENYAHNWGPKVSFPVTVFSWHYKAPEKVGTTIGMPALDRDTAAGYYTGKVFGDRS